MIDASPFLPEIVVWPVALSVQAVASAVPPPVLSTDFVSVRWAGLGGTNVFVIEQLAVSPGARTRLLPVSVPPVQAHEPAV